VKQPCPYCKAPDPISRDYRSNPEECDGGFLLCEACGGIYTMEGDGQTRLMNQAERGELREHPQRELIQSMQQAVLDRLCG
jgi:uncharacterized protein YbaR (Trm112 family)